MKIKCKTNRINDIEPTQRKALLLASNGNFPDEDDNLIIGQEYTVYGILFLENSFMYLICEYEDDLYPKFKFPYFFEVSDHRLSRFWQLDDNLVKQGIAYPFISFPEWANKVDFYDDLLDDDPDAQHIFLKYKELMDLEFADSTTTTMKFAKHIEDCWFMCDSCIYAWEDRNFLEMTRCPKCKTIYLNPINSNSLD